MAGNSLSEAELEVDGTRLSLRVDGRWLTGADLVGAEIEVPGLGELRIDAAELDPDARFEDFWLYQARVRVPGTEVFESICEPDEGGDTRMVVFAGDFDAHMRYRGGSNRFSLSCVSGVQAKCLRWGYEPWRSAPDTGVSLLGHYNACLQLARADYCGDDTPTTRDGTMIDVYDRDGVQAPETEPALIEGLAFEAGWNADGAVCVHHARIAEHLDLSKLGSSCPRLANAPLGAACDEAEAQRRGAVLFNRSRITASGAGASRPSGAPSPD